VKKFFSLFMITVLVLSLSACMVKVEIPENIPPKGQGIVGEWEFCEVKFEKPKNPVNIAVANVLAEKIKLGDKAIFRDDKTGKIGDEEITYTFENGILTVIWNENINYKFEVSFDEGRMELEIDDMFEGELK